MNSIKLTKFLWIFIYISLSILLVRGMYHIYSILSFPYDITNGEGFVLRDAHNIFRGVSVYQPVNEEPFIVSNYPPLFPWIAAKFMLITGPSFFATRILSVISFISIAILIFFSLKRKGINLQYSIVSALLFFSSIYVYYWSAWSRVDGLAAFFSLLAFVVIWMNVDNRSIIIAAILCFAAVATKQSALSAFAAIALFLLIRKRTSLVIFIAVFSFLTLPSIFVLNNQTNGEFLKHIITYNQLEWYPRVFLGQFKNFAFTHFLFLISYFLFVLNYWKNKEYTLPIIYSTISLITTVTTGREGASTNYFIESIAIICILIGIIIQDLLTKTSTIRFFGFSLLILQIAIFAFPDMKIVNYFNKHTVDFGLNPTDKDVAECDKLNEYIRTASGKILIENPGFAVINNKEVIGNAAVLKFFRRKGWNEPVDNFINSIDNKTYELIIFQGEAYDMDVLFATDRTYHEVARINCLGEYEIKARNQ